MPITKPIRFLKRLQQVIAAAFYCIWISFFLNSDNFHIDLLFPFSFILRRALFRCQRW